MRHARLPSWVLKLACAMLPAWALPAPATAGQGGFGPGIVQSGTAYYGESAFNYLDQNAGFSFIPFDYHTAKPNPFFGAGSIDDFPYIGVGVSAYANAAAGIVGYASVANTLNYNWRQDITTAVVGADDLGTSFVGTPFAIGSFASIAGHTMSTGAGAFEAGLSAFENFGIGAKIKACFYVCVGPDIGLGDDEGGHTVVLAAYSSANNSVTAFNQVYQGVLPKTFSDDQDLFKVGIYAPDLSGSRQGNEQSHASLYTNTTLASAYINVAGAVALAYGVPSEVLKGSLLGFDYETVGAYVGAALNLEQSVSMRPLILDEVYHFTSPVERYNDVTGTWDYAGTSISLLPNEFATVRAPNAFNVGLSVENRASFIVDTTLDLSAELQAQLVLLHLTGHDIDVALLNHTYNLGVSEDLLRVEDHRITQLQSVFEDPINLSFSIDPAVLCPSCQNTGLIEVTLLPTFPPDPAPDPGDSTLPQSHLIFKVINFGAPGCNNIVTTSCVIDTSQRPGRNVTRGTRAAGMQRNALLAGGAGGSGSTDYSANGFDAYDALNMQLDTDAMTPEQLHAANLAMLAAVYPNGVRPVLGVLGGVPEPASWALLIGGFGMVGAAARRGRRVVA